MKPSWHFKLYSTLYRFKSVNSVNIKNNKQGKIIINKNTLMKNMIKENVH